MLNPKDNERLTQTGPGTPMGKLLREYWWPVLRADKLEPDGAPERVRLLGENYVAFRDTQGKLGLLDEYCPHRRVSLMLARNEDCGLRCIMHGWKIDVNGKVVETPNEVEAGARLDRIKVRHFPIREAAGMIWAYVGDKEAPPLPNFPFLDAVTIEPLICKINANWVQVMETLWDPAHVAILHAQDNNFASIYEGSDSVFNRAADAPPPALAVSGCEVRDESYGFRFQFTNTAKGLTHEEGWIPTAMPCWIFITSASPDENADRLVFAHTPVDDTHMLLFQIPYNLKKGFGDFGSINVKCMSEEARHDFRLPERVAENNWGQDRPAMKAGSFTGLGTGHGVLGLLNQDVAVAESMGPITDRQHEHLGPADHAVIKGRQMLLEALRNYEAGKGALGLDDDYSQIGVHGGREFEAAA